jgi:hypothetical protein
VTFLGRAAGPILFAALAAAVGYRGALVGAGFLAVLSAGVATVAIE